jgi:predicted dehydrogenase
LTKQSLIAGKHVFVEKPFTLSSAEAKELIEIAQKKRKIIMVGHLLKYHPAVIKIKKMIDSGELGEIYYIYSQRVNLGKVRRDESVLWSLTVHDISVILYFLDKEPTAVSALGQCCLQNKIEDVAFLTLQFGDRKLAHIHVSWLDPHKIRKFTIVGNKKMVVFDDMESSEKIKIYDKGVNISNNFVSYQEFITLRDGDIYVPSVKMEEPLKLECGNFINCIRNNIQPLTDGHDGLRTVKVLEAAQKSILNGGKRVKLQ